MMKINAQNLAEFREQGITCIRHVVPKSLTEPAKEAILRELERLRLKENGKWQTKSLKGVSPFQVTITIGQKLQRLPEFDRVISPELVSSLNEMVDWKIPTTKAFPQVLITPPQKESWSIPEMGWHVDIASPSKDVVPGVQVFVLLDDIAPKGGATMAMKGSHRAGKMDAIAENVVEMSGKAGDVFIMDMRVLHAPSINATKNARMMLTSRFLRQN